MEKPCELWALDKRSSEIRNKIRFYFLRQEVQEVLVRSPISISSFLLEWFLLEETKTSWCLNDFIGYILGPFRKRLEVSRMGSQNANSMS